MQLGWLIFETQVKLLRQRHLPDTCTLLSHPQMRRAKRKKEGEKYLKSETVNPAFEAEEAAEGGHGPGASAGGGGGATALARGDDFERLRVEPAAAGGKAGAAGTPKGGKRGVAAAAGAGALGGLLGRKKVRL